jgi:general secretion pathway protein J
MRRRASINPQHGFTLFEILVAVSIFAVIGVISMTNLIQVGRSGERISEAQQQLAEVQFALGYFGRDILQMVGRKVRDQYGDEQHHLILQPETLVFTRGGWRNLVNAPRSELQRVAWGIEDTQLYREHWLQLDQGYTESRVRQPLLGGVRDLQFRLVDKEGESIEEWPLEIESETAPKPVLIEISFHLENFGRVLRVYETSDALG